MVQQYARELGIDQIATGHYAESVMTQSQDATSCEGRSQWISPTFL